MKRQERMYLMGMVLSSAVKAFRSGNRTTYGESCSISLFELTPAKVDSPNIVSLHSVASFGRNLRLIPDWIFLSNIAFRMFHWSKYSRFLSLILQNMLMLSIINWAFLNPPNFSEVLYTVSKGFVLLLYWSGFLQSSVRLCRSRYLHPCKLVWSRFVSSHTFWCCLLSYVILFFSSGCSIASSLSLPSICSSRNFFRMLRRWGLIIHRNCEKYFYEAS